MKAKKNGKSRGELIIMAIIKKFIIKLYQVISDFILYRSYKKFRW